MTTEAEVRLWDHLVGTLSWDEHKLHSFFRFDGDFLKKGLDIAPLLMPVNHIDPKLIYSFIPNSETDYAAFRGLPAFIADSLPDSFGNRVINSWLIRQGRPSDSLSPLERLCYTGKRGLGALEFFSAISGKDNLVDVDVKGLIDLAQEVFSVRQNLNTDFVGGDAGLMEIVRVGTSAGGARPKAVIAYNEATGKVKSGQIAEVPPGFEHWLIKLDGVSKSEELGLSSGMGRVEYAYHLMAKDCGINMAECRLLEENGRAHFMTRRFDRPGGGEKLHMQTLNALANMNYKLIGEHYYERLFSTIRAMKLTHIAIEQQYRRMIFNVIAKNCDDHTKNVSFLMDKSGTWSLSPAYDISYAYNPAGRWNRMHLMGLNGKFENFSVKDFEEVGNQQGIKNRNAIIDQVCEVVSRWPEYARSAGVDQSLYEKIGAVHETHINLNENVTIVKPSNKLKDIIGDKNKHKITNQSPNRQMKP